MSSVLSHLPEEDVKREVRTFLKTILEKTISYRALLLLILTVFFLCLAPLLYLGRYDVPCNDDYTYGAPAHLVLKHGGTVVEAVAAAIRHIGITYQGWQGSYSAILLMCLQPTVFSESLYWLTPWLMFTSLFSGLFVMCVCLLYRVFGLPRELGGILAGLLGILYLLLVPNPVESFYWFNGAVYYTFFHGLAMLTIAQAVRTAQEGGTARIVGLCLLAVVLGGGNLMTGLTLCLLAVSGPLLLLLENKTPAAKRLLLPALFMLAAFLVNTLAPGNAFRQAGSDHIPAVLPALGMSFRHAARFLYQWLRLPVLGVLLTLGLLFWAALPASRFSFRYPGLVSLYSFCLFAAMFCPTAYAPGTTPVHRMLDIIYCSYLLLLALNLLYWLGWLRQRHAARTAAAEPALLKTLGSLALCVLLLAVSGKLSGGISLVSAYTALTTGQAEAYYQASQDRLAILKDPTVRVARLKPYADPPYLLFFDDLTIDPYDWHNRDMAIFYEKERVELDICE